MGRLRHKISKTTPCKVEIRPCGALFAPTEACRRADSARNDAGVDIPPIVDAVDAEAEQAQELALVFAKVSQLAERFGGEQRPAPRHFLLNLGRKLPVVEPQAHVLVDGSILAQSRAKQAIDLLDAAFVQPELLHHLE